MVAFLKPDAKAKLPSTVFTYTFGIITALVTGVGMCLSMNVIGSGTTFTFVMGVVLHSDDFIYRPHLHLCCRRNREYAGVCGLQYVGVLPLHIIGGGSRISHMGNCHTG